MILFKKISWKNFLSTGNHMIDVDLNENSTTLIIGANGTGKSTILDALTFVLYGRPFRKISKSQLVNATNEKDCLVEIEFTVNTTDWKVVRGFKPSIFKITRNGEELDQSSSQLDQQKHRYSECYFKRMGNAHTETSAQLLENYCSWKFPIK